MSRLLAFFLAGLVGIPSSIWLNAQLDRHHWASARTLRVSRCYVCGPGYDILAFADVDSVLLLNADLWPKYRPWTDSVKVRCDSRNLVHVRLYAHQTDATERLVLTTDEDHVVLLPASDLSSVMRLIAARRPVP